MFVQTYFGIKSALGTCWLSFKGLEPRRSGRAYVLRDFAIADCVVQYPGMWGLLPETSLHNLTVASVSLCNTGIYLFHFYYIFLCSAVEKSPNS